MPDSNVVPMLRALKKPRSDITERQMAMVMLALDLKHDAGNVRGREGSMLLCEALILESLADRDMPTLLEAVKGLIFELRQLPDGAA